MDDIRIIRALGQSQVAQLLRNNVDKATVNKAVKTSALVFFSLIAILPASERSLPSRGGSKRQTASDHAQALFAGGCFWGVEAAFRKVNGVVATTAGYTDGFTVDPTYRAVSLHMTGHAEAVLITYDPVKVSYAELLDVFWGCHDPSADPGESHRSAIFYFNHDQEATAHDSMAECARRGFFAHAIRTQIAPATRFYRAEEYHQHYFERLGGGNRCQIGRRCVQTRLAEDAARSRTAKAALMVSKVSY